MKTSITASPPFFNSSAGMLSFPAAFTFFNDLTAVSTSSRRIGKSSSFDNSCLARTLGSPLVWKLYSSVDDVFFSSEAFPFFVLNGVDFYLPLLYQFFHDLVSSPAVVVGEAVFNFRARFFYPVFFVLFHSFLIFLLISLHFGASSSVFFSCFKSLLVSHMKKVSSVKCCSCHHCGGANFPPSVAWNDSEI